MTTRSFCGLLLVTLLLFVPASSFAGSWNGWIYQNPYPTSNTLWAVKFITPQKGWAAGELGTILYTANSGETWEAQESGTEQLIRSLSFVNERVGWAVGSAGVILHTEDGGKTWASQTDISVGLTNVFFLTDQDGWAVGQDGVVLHTADGGTTWQKQQTGITRSLAGVYFITPQRGWLLAGDEVYRTADGGKTWEPSKLDVKIPRGGTVNGGPMISMMGERLDQSWDRGAIAFVDENTGWAVVGLWFIFQTTDGGKTWVNQLTTGYMSYGLYGLAVTGGKAACALGTSILCTADGKTWNERLGIRPAGTKSIEGFSFLPRGIAFATPSTGWVVGVDGLIMKTEDGGTKWTMVSRWDRCGGGPVFVSKKTGWLYGARADSICRTDDGGRTWVKQAVGMELTNLFFITDSLGWAVGRQEEGRGGNNQGKIYGVIRGTIDGGKTWETRFKRSENDLFNVFFINSDVGWVVGKENNIPYILRTQDGGKHWDRYPIGVNLYFGRAWFVDVQEGWIIGFIVTEEARNSYILHTTDSGKHWEVAHTIQDVDLYSITFTDKRSGWAMGQTEYGDQAWLLQTKDGGKTWTEKVFVNPSGGPPGFLDQARGVLAPEKGMMFVTTDGGKTWGKRRAPLRPYPWHFSEIFETKSRD